MYEVEEQARVLRWSSDLNSQLGRRDEPRCAELPRQRSPLEPTTPPTAA